MAPEIARFRFALICQFAPFGLMPTHGLAAGAAPGIDMSIFFTLSGFAIALSNICEGRRKAPTMGRPQQKARTDTAGRASTPAGTSAA